MDGVDSTLAPFFALLQALQKRVNRHSSGDKVVFIKGHRDGDMWGIQGLSSFVKSCLILAKLLSFNTF
ncbi:hypothetical protein BN341_14580 [Helicobacter heilmannii ASB1.4]|nr:hypothetical protein BN341_14580 [Helicobacter heilmannii ASB1.4]